MGQRLYRLHGFAHLHGRRRRGNRDGGRGQNSRSRRGHDRLHRDVSESGLRGADLHRDGCRHVARISPLLRVGQARRNGQHHPVHAEQSRHRLRGPGDPLRPRKADADRRHGRAASGRSHVQRPLCRRALHADLGRNDGGRQQYEKRRSCHAELPDRGRLRRRRCAGHAELYGGQRAEP